MVKSVSAGIKKIVEEKGLKRGFVAARAGLTPQQFCDMLNGRKLILAEHLPPLAEALGVSIPDIFEAGKEASENDD